MKTIINDAAIVHLNWVIKLIHSCRDTFQIECSKRLIELFHERYQDDTLTAELKAAYQYTYNKIHQILN